jgi:hypothetical protein
MAGDWEKVQDVRVVEAVRVVKPGAGVAYYLMGIAFCLGAAVLFMEYAGQHKSGETALQQQVRALWFIQMQLAVIGVVLFLGLAAIVAMLRRD